MKKMPLIVIVSMTVLIAGYIGVDSFLKWHNNEIRITETRGKNECDQHLVVLEQKIQHLEEELFKEKGAHLSLDIIHDAFGRDITDLISSKETLPPDDCESLKQALASFFYYLDNNGYSDRYNFNDGSISYYKNVLTLLKRNPPQFADETAELLTLFRSLSHFSRILGRKGALIIKDILENETDMVEPALAIFYQILLNSPKCANPDLVPDLTTLYEYAHFFMNSISGKSYLMRRNSKLRILARYYCLQVIQLAEKHSLNLYGFDPRYQAKLLLSDVKSHRGLVYKELYVDTLEGMVNQEPAPLFNDTKTP